jgi:hypothetical protein
VVGGIQDNDSYLGDLLTMNQAKMVSSQLISNRNLEKEEKWFWKLMKSLFWRHK